MPESEAKFYKMLRSMDNDQIIRILLKKILMKEMKEERLLKKLKFQAKI